MLIAPYAEILRHEGFQLAGSLEYRLSLTAWWNPSPDKLIQIIILSVGPAVMIKGDKSYYLKSVSTAGETWARDIGQLHDYLEGHFPELRISFSHFRDVPPHLAQSEVHRRSEIDAPTRAFPTVEEIAQLQGQLRARKENTQATAGMLSQMSRKSDLMAAYTHQQLRNNRAQIDQLQAQINGKQQRLGLLQHLQREYQQKGSAAVYTFSISSNIQIAENPDQLRDALGAVVKELTDMNRYQVTQKLGGGRLNIHVVEATEPAMAWIEQWFGGALTPAQTSRLGSAFDQIRKAAEDHVIVTPDDSIEVNQVVRHAGKHLAAHVISDVVGRLDNTDRATTGVALSPGTVRPETIPLSLGWRVDDSGKLIEPVFFPLTQMVHLYISGTTGGGKSFLARVLIEEAAQHKSLNIFVLDPRNQSIGILVPEDRPAILEQYERFRMKPGSARGFDFKYFAPGLSCAAPLPPDLSQLASGRSIVSFKGVDDEQRCALAARILDAVFEECSAAEAEHPRLLIIVDEAQLFTRRRLDESAKQSAAKVERALDRIAREGRKFGIVLALVSQTMKDFAYELASIRQMTTTKVFLRNSDREIEYADDIIGDGRLLVQLPTGTAIAHNANWGVIRIRVRPPYSKVFELGEAEIRQVIGRDRDPSKPVSADARRLLAVIKEHGSSPDQPLNMSRAAEFARISSKRRFLELIGELEQAGIIRTRKLLERGCPRVIQLVNDTACPTQDPQ
jgi:hypothetical protein